TVAIAGITAFRTAYHLPKARLGLQDPATVPGWPEDITLWVVPQPSGLNAHASVASLAEGWREGARSADVAWHEDGAAEGGTAPADATSPRRPTARWEPGRTACPAPMAPPPAGPPPWWDRARCGVARCPVTGAVTSTCPSPCSRA